ncbi:MAG: NAD(+)/NADH kinase [Eubacterium sp.]|nr:NAD(+)/NADH kinase [Eubacterium sp.]
MNKFLVITNRKKDSHLELTEQIRYHLTIHGAQCHVFDDYGPEIDLPSAIPEGTECILIIGGDGTILGAARALVETGIPLLGINMGTMGFLADVKPSALAAALNRLLADDYRIEERIMLCADVFRDGKKICHYLALNEIYLMKAGVQTTVGLQIRINDVAFDSYMADGVIVCSPTGSTAYNLSAGGPIINPTCKNFVITPICPHSLTARSVVLSKSDIVSVILESGRNHNDNSAIVCYDGRIGETIHQGDKVVIYRAGVVTPFVKVGEVNFVDILKEKMLR